MRVESNKHKTKVHFYSYHEEAWEMVRKGLVPLDVAQNQSICGNWKALVTKDKSKVSCHNCLRAIKALDEKLAA